MTQSFPEIAKWIGTYLVGSDALTPITQEPKKWAKLRYK